MESKQVNIVCIGAGALGFTTGVVADLIRCPELAPPSKSQQESVN